MSFHLESPLLYCARIFDMRRRNFLGLVIGAVAFVLSGFKTAKAKTAADLKGPITKIAFGSCCIQDGPQPIWDVIAKSAPDVFLFIGDNIYADTEDMTLMANKYKMLGKKPGFARFRNATPVLATWDDHDYGINDGGLEYPKKEESKKLMLDFFGEPAKSERRQRPGIYTSYYLGPKGKKLQIILLDLRWFRTALNYDKAIDGYKPDPSPKATILGEKQWEWLASELKKPADLRLIASSTQFVSPDHKWEKWANFPIDKKRMIDLLDENKITNAIFISGDMHYAELSAETSPKGFKIYDLTASGMNLVENGSQYPNRYRISLYDKTPHFGLIEIDWQKSSANLALKVISDKGKTVISDKVSYPIA